MEAKDTVMTDNEIIEFMAKLVENPGLLARAIKVISKAQYDNGKEEGVKEVVEWINTNYMIRLSPTKRNQWEVQLKKWGISSLKGEGGICQLELGQ